MIQVLPTDVTFTMSRDAGAGCLCSRCLLPIISEAPIKVILDSELAPKDKHEFRYHLECIKVKPKNNGWGDNYENLPY